MCRKKRTAFPARSTQEGHLVSKAVEELAGSDLENPSSVGFRVR